MSFVHVISPNTESGLYNNGNKNAYWEIATLNVKFSSKSSNWWITFFHFYACSATLETHIKKESELYMATLGVVSLVTTEIVVDTRRKYCHTHRAWLRVLEFRVREINRNKYRSLNTRNNGYTFEYWNPGDNWTYYSWCTIGALGSHPCTWLYVQQQWPKCTSTFMDTS
jgi:hypothetical protein